MTIPVTKLDFSGDPAPLFCPVCGQGVFAENSKGMCKHVVFAGEDESGEWGWNNAAHESLFSDAVKEKYQKDPEDSENFDDYISSLGIDDAAKIAAEALTSPSCFMLQVATSGNGCGGPPTGSTMYAIIDYEPSAQ